MRPMLVPLPGFPHLALAACPGCGVGFGVASHPAARWALRWHLRDCPNGQACPQCWGEGALVARTPGGERRCADCWAAVGMVTG
jgi:hypothetical protein